MPSTTGQSDDTLQADVASFVSSLGFASSDTGIGFNDADFRKTGPINAKHKLSKAEKKKDVDAKEGQTQAKNIRKRKRQPREQDESGDVKIAKLKQGAHKKESGDLKTAKLKQGAHNKKESDGTAHGNRNITGNFKQGRNQSVSTGFANNNEVQQGHTQKQTSKTFTKIWSLLKSGPWYEVAGSLLSSGQDKQKPISKGNEDWGTLLSKAKTKGEHLMELASAEFEKSRGKDSDMRWLMMARKTGTTADKVAAFTVLLQDNPVANLKAFDALIGMVTSKGGKRHAVMGIDALKELFLTSLLPDRKLKYLAQQPLQAQWDTQEGERLLFFWYWEDCLKHRYEQFVSSLEEATKDKLPFLKEKAVKTIYELLKAKPELERRLLSVLVNKLGDPERKVASNAGYYLSCLLTSHPNMKMVVVEEVDSFLFRPHLGLRSKYQAVVFLNQIVLSNRGDGPKLAKRLIDIYFSLFKVLTAGGLDARESKDGKRRKKTKSLDSQSQKQLVTDAENAVEMDSRLLSALLTGVNRAFPFVAADEIDIIIQEHTPVLLRLVHSKSFNVGVQALMLLYQLLAKNHAISDRFYRALYAVLFSPGLAKSSKMEMFLGLIFKAIKSDLNAKRMAAFAKRLMQVALQGPAQFACGCLLLLSEVLKLRPTLWNAVTQPEDEDEETEHFYDIGEELPLTNSAIVGSTDDAHDSSITKDLKKDHSVEVESSSESDDLKCEVSDIEDDDESTSADEEIAIKKSETNVGSPSKAGTPKMEHPSTSLSSMERWPRSGYYKARHREPSFSNADRACWWELSALSCHVHPSVSTMAKTLLSGASILYAGNPVRDLTLGVFLDRFTEKKPKSRKKSGDWHGSSLSAPSKVSTPTTLPIGMEFLKLSEKEIAPEDVVFHKFYTSRMNRKGSSKKKAKDSDEVIAGDADEDDYLGEDGDISDEDEIEDMLEQEEGMEMDSSDFSEEDNESDWNWAHDEIEGPAQARDMLENREDDDEIGEGNEVEEHGVLLNANGKKQSHGNKLHKQANRKSISRTEHSQKSPFASFDEFSHLLDDRELDQAMKKVAKSKKKSRKHGK